jgi:uncharacterized protein YecE (DUF72 family)
MGYCVHDMAGFPCAPWVTGPVAYVRFHGPTEKRYAGRYDHDHLRRWAGHIEAIRRAGHDVYVYFNNDNGGHAVTNALELKALLGLAE